MECQARGAGNEPGFSFCSSVTWVRHDPDDPFFAGHNVETPIMHDGKLIAVGGAEASR